MRRENDHPLTEREAYKKALKRGTRYRVPKLSPAVAITVVLLAMIICVCSVIIVSRDGGVSPDVTDSGTTVTTVMEDATEGQRILLSRDQVYEGDLILVNSDFEYRFPDVPSNVSVYDNKTLSYKVGDRNVTLSMTAIEPFNRLMDDFYAETNCRDVMIVSGGGFRTEEFQRQLYSDRVASAGAEEAAKYVALPGHSEHHTGLAMDLTIYTDSGEGHTLRTYEKCAWLVDNFENYGFILRYPEDKAGITGISYESWHYRYVGSPHSVIMKQMGFCLEEYVEHLRGLPEGTAISWNGISAEEVSLEETSNDYTVYFVPAAESGETEIVIPKSRDYTVSGDNVSGFIITLLPVEGDYGNEQ